MTEIYKNQSDESLMLAFANNDDMQSFGALFNRYDSQLVNFVARRLNCQSIAQDICQETWCSIINNKKNYHTSAKFKTFIYHILHNKLIDYYRKQNKNSLNLSNDIFDIEQKNKEEFFIDESADSNPLYGYNKQQIKLILNDALEKISVADRELLEMRYFLQLSVAEIADILDTPKETCKSRIRYAKNKLKRKCQRQKTEILSMLQYD